MVKAATIIRGDRRQSRRTALHFAAEKGLAAVAFALLSRPEFEEGRAVATFNGTSWIAIERTVAKGHICLAKGIDVFLDHMMSSALPSGSASSDNGYVWARIGQKLDDVRINTEYTERARPQSPGKHRHLPDFSGANDGGPPPIFFPRPCRGQMAVLETSYKHMFQDSPD